VRAATAYAGLDNSDSRGFRLETPLEGLTCPTAIGRPDRETKEKEMIGKIPASVAKLATAAFAAAALFAVTASAASAVEVIYSDLPAVKPGNVVSQGFEATQTSSLGGQVEFGATARKNPTVTVIMSSWACQSGTWYGKNCVSEMSAIFE
jgi:hypothetical protein